jgi:hypothetical protein
MGRNSSGRGRPSLPCSFHCCLWVKLWRIYRYLSCTHPPEMIFDQSLIYFDLPVCPATQVGLVLLFQLNTYNLKKKLYESNQEGLHGQKEGMDGDS